VAERIVGSDRVPATTVIVEGGGPEPADTGRMALTTATRPLEVRNPLLAFVEREAGQEVDDPAGVTLPPTGGPRTAGPTSGQWGSG
jgi:hypothetical protein